MFTMCVATSLIPGTLHCPCLVRVRIGDSELHLSVANNIPWGLASTCSQDGFWLLFTQMLSLSSGPEEQGHRQGALPFTGSAGPQLSFEHSSGPTSGPIKNPARAGEWQKSGFISVVLPAPQPLMTLCLSFSLQMQATYREGLPLQTMGCWSWDS